MSTHPETTRPTAQEIEGWYSAAACSVEEFAALVETRTDPADYPWADDVIQNVLIYGRRIQSALVNEESRRAIQTELAQALLTGPGIVVFRQAFDPSVVDRGTKAFEALIAAQKAAGVQSGDHFAKPGANDRVWGALDKFALRDPAAIDPRREAQDAVARPGPRHGVAVYRSLPRKATSGAVDARGGRR